MAAAEPDFVDLCVRTGRFVPIRRLKPFSFFVECQRVGDAQHIARVDAMKAADGAAKSQSANRVPDAEEVEVYRPMP